MAEVHRMALARNVTLARLFGVLGGIALFLGAVGVYGVLSYLVSQRTAEIGIRTALGAHPRSLVALFVRQALGVAVTGVVIGVPGRSPACCAVVLTTLSRPHPCQRLHGPDKCLDCRCLRARPSCRSD
jgi:predicted lysophospholipase L1 biosynthesis ABC-type transport system permease subunit